MPPSWVGAGMFGALIVAGGIGCALECRSAAKVLHALQ